MLVSYTSLTGVLVILLCLTHVSYSGTLAFAKYHQNELEGVRLGREVEVGAEVRQGRGVV